MRCVVRDIIDRTCLRPCVDACKDSDIGAMSAVLAARLCALSLRRAAPQPKAAAVQLSARRCASLSAGASGLRAQPAAARKAAVAVQVVALKNNKTKTRKAAAKRFKVTASGKVSLRGVSLCRCRSVVAGRAGRCETLGLVVQPGRPRAGSAWTRLGLTRAVAVGRSAARHEGASLGEKVSCAETTP
jgi:hypothetical protein